MTRTRAVLYALQIVGVLIVAAVVIACQSVSAQIERWGR